LGTGLTAPIYLNTVLCEYLASHGYVAIAVPSMAYREDVSPGYDALTIETHLRDLELVIHELRDYPGVDIENLGLVAWGSGGIAQVLLQMKNPNVAAVASLDAASGYRYGHELITASLYFEPSRARAAFFHATDSRATTSRAEKSFEYYDSVHRGPSYLLLIEGAAHAEFTSLASVVPLDGRPEVRRRYRLLCEYVRRFLDLAMKDDTAAAEFLEVTPSRHGFDGLILSKRP
jgi:dienelactone hydrolase